MDSVEKILFFVKVGWTKPDSLNLQVKRVQPRLKKSTYFERWM